MFLKFWAFAAILLAAPAVSARPPTVDPTYGLHLSAAGKSVIQTRPRF